MPQGAASAWVPRAQSQAAPQGNFLQAQCCVCTGAVCTRVCEPLCVCVCELYHAASTWLLAVIRPKTGCDCQSELEGLEILGGIIRFHIVTAAAIRGSGRLISNPTPTPPLPSLLINIH